MLPQPVAALSRERILQASAGELFSIALTDTGRVFTWGWGRGGQLGHGDESDRTTPTAVKALHTAQCFHASAGSGHAVVLAMTAPAAGTAAAPNTAVYSWGFEDSGRLGRPGENCLPAAVTTFVE